jgi:subtilisin-like proprotein convertase family protein
MLPREDGGRLVYECWLLPADPPGAFRVRVDGRTGEPLEVEDRRQFFDGTGRAFHPNPVVSLRDRTLRDQGDAAEAVPEAAYTAVILPELAGSGTAEDPYTLTGPYVSTVGTPDRAISLDGRFLFDRSDPQFEEVMVYHHIDSVQRGIQSLGFDDVCRRQVQVFVNSQPPGIPFPATQSFYRPDGRGTGVLAFGTGGVDAAEDGEIIAHEYGHAILDDQVLNFGESREALALAEGFCDFLAAAVFSGVSQGFGDACIGEWKAASASPDPPPCLRRLDTAKRYPYDMTYGDRYQDSEIWSGALWDLAGVLGADTALTIAIEGNFYLDPDASFAEAGESLLLADEQLSQGAHRGAIETVLRARGILRPPLRLDGFILRDEEPDAVIPDDDPFGLESRLECPEEETIRSELSLQVHVDLVHPFPTDLVVTLVSPAGTEVRLTPPWSFPTIYGSLDRPLEGSFASLVGEGTSGTWRLRVVDRVPREAGTLRAWGIRARNLTRGEANGDDQVDISDAVRILLHLFGGRAIACEFRADTNDDGAVDVTDPVYLLLFLFQGGPPPPPPFVLPGSDPTPDDLRCGEA